MTNWLGGYVEYNKYQSAGIVIMIRFQFQFGTCMVLFTFIYQTHLNDRNTWKDPSCEHDGSRTTYQLV